MTNVNALLNERMKKDKRSAKMTALAKQSAEGGRTGYAAIFGSAELTTSETERLEDILYQYTEKEADIETDLTQLIAISSEVKAINHQAALLHGERIKKAQEILKDYREGAFTAWMIAAYGNRQTPYNFLQFFEFYSTLPKTLHPQLEIMPRQAIYTLASREGELQKKHEIIEQYNGETKEKLLEIIREEFPLRRTDRRKASPGEKIVRELTWICGSFARHRSAITKKQKKNIQELMRTLEGLLDHS